MKLVKSLGVLLTVVTLAVSIPVKVYASSNSSIWIGDSRGVGLSQTVVTDDYEFIAKCGMSYSWFNYDAIPRLQSYLNSNPNRTVVINMGVNDCANICCGGNSTVNKYIEDINKLIKKYPSTHFYYLSTNPVDGDYPSSYSSTGYIDKDELNDIINEFNALMKNRCNATYIDCNSYLMEEGFSTFDGIHYTSETYQDIYNYTERYINLDYVRCYYELCKDRPQRFNKWGWVWCKPFCEWMSKSL